MDSNSVDVWVALLAAIFGGAGLKVTESILTSRQRKAESMQTLVQQKDKDVESARKAQTEAEESEKEWREKYWALREKEFDEREHPGGTGP
jgi:hypothetical protein